MMTVAMDGQLDKPSLLVMWALLQLAKLCPLRNVMARQEFPIQVKYGGTNKVTSFRSMDIFHLSFYMTRVCNCQGEYFVT